MRMVGACDRAAEFEVARDLGDVEEHFFQISRHRDFFHRIGELSTGDPDAGGAAGIIARDQVGALAQEFGYIQPFLISRDQFFRRLGARLQEIIARADPGRAGKSARGVAVS